MSNLLRLKGAEVLKTVLRFHSPSRRTCPRCGCESSSDIRPYSSYNSTTLSPTVPATVKRMKKRKSKQASLTEIIQVTADSVVSESTTAVSKMKPKEVQKCIEKMTKAIRRPFDQPPSSLLTMSYVTASNITGGPDDSHITRFSAARPMELEELEEGHGHGQYHVDSTSMMSEEEFLKSLAASHGIEGIGTEEEKVVIRTSTSKYEIPTENDLIDHEGEYDLGVATQSFPAHDSTGTGLGSIPVVPDPAKEMNPLESKQVHRMSSKMKKESLKKLKQIQMSKEQKEESAKIRIEEMQRLGKETSMNKSLVSYLEMCVFSDQLQRALTTLHHYRSRNKASSQYPKVTDIRAYNVLLHGFAEKGNIHRVREIFRMTMEDSLTPNPQSYAALLECLGRNPASKNNLHSIRQSIKYLENAAYSLNDLFNKVTFEGDQRETILEAIRRVQPSFKPTIEPPFVDYACPLLDHLNNESAPYTVVSPAEGLLTLETLEEKARYQLEMERRGTITIKSIENKNDLENLDYYRGIAQETEKKWAAAIEEAFERNMNTLLNQGMRHKSHRAISLYPFLKVLPPSDYVHIIIQEIRKLSEGSETYSPGVIQLYRELGAKVLARYQLLYKEQKGILDKVEELYSAYLKWFLNPSAHPGGPPAFNSRQKWQQLLSHPDSTGPHVDIVEKVWPNSVLSSVGRFLYGIIMRDIKINANVMKINSKTEQMVPAFYSIFRMQGMHLKEEIKPHPALVKLFQAASRDELTFDSTLVPMLCPPLPWASIRTGGYLLSPAKIVRLPHQAHQQKVRLETCPPEDLYPSLDSLNQLGVVPWKINHKVLDTIVEVFNNKGDDNLNVPPPPSECPPPPTLDPSMTRQEKYKVHKERAAIKRKKGEMYSLWCDALYRLSLANHFRDEIFWFPHNMDFRGRVYPCPPHLNHLGADLARSILVFAKGKPLGQKGLDWLKLHLVNLTGLKKRDSIQERLNYADSVMDEILDSADFPLTGRKWWAESEEPWQTLACCNEIANAVRSGDPVSYVSHFPIHQDGSCNGLQHYAALGRDQAGAESVNLAPSDVPQDVYSSVAKLVENMRAKDAENGVKIAQVLDGFIRRKVIKQTVMTTVYGVTRYGARLQIARQLKDIPEFPKEHLWPASLYLVGRTFDSLQEMFTSTKEIQDWFTECARLISQVCGQNVEWVTPLGLPVVQPYFRPSKKSVDYSDPLRIPDQHIFDLYERPNVMKQKNAFPPNFIHSLDSSHMMLTSLHCEREGITFVSVHDCYWTHPATVEIMNRVCREQFVALHSQPILEDLSRFLVEKYSYRASDFTKHGSIVDASKHQLNGVLRDVPVKGMFDLNQVLQSVFFFS